MSAFILRTVGGTFFAAALLFAGVPAFSAGWWATAGAFLFAIVVEQSLRRGTR